jgi:lipid-binding SYLF domain-containing protein
MRIILPLVLGVALTGPAFVAGCSSDSSSSTSNNATRNYALEEQAAQTRTFFVTQDPRLQNMFNTAAGYVIFPRIGAGGFIVGASAGEGVLFEGGVPTMYANVAAGSIGAQVGGQAFSQVIFFENAITLDRFKRGQFQFDAGASAVAVRSGGSARLDYTNGVAVFIGDERGLMASATIGGQKFTVRPIPGN